MDGDFIVTPKQDKSVTMTIRVDRIVQERFDELARQSNRSRNELVNMALEYALQNLKFMNSDEKGNT